jgi:myosin heavy subunit
MDAYRKCLENVCKAGIVTKSDFRKWALKNHPDKGGNEELFKLINDCVSKDIFCTEVTGCTDEYREMLKMEIDKSKNSIDFRIPIIKDLKENGIREAEEKIKESKHHHKDIRKRYLGKKPSEAALRFSPEQREKIVNDFKEFIQKAEQELEDVYDEIKQNEEHIIQMKKDIKEYEEQLKICDEIEELKKIIRKKLEKQMQPDRPKQPLRITSSQPKVKQSPIKKQRKPRTLKPCKEKYMRDPMTCKCIVDKTKKECLASQTLNPLTGRCLSNYDPSKKC